jgi:hypothetical protein
MSCSLEIYSKAYFVYSMIGSAVFLFPPPHTVTILGAVFVLFENKLLSTYRISCSYLPAAKQNTGVPIFGHSVEVSDWLGSMVKSKNGTVFLQCKHAVI